MKKPSYKTLNDLQLAALLTAGDREAFGEIYRRYWDVLYLHALRGLSNEDEAKDLVQELFTSLWMKKPEISLKASLPGYLYVAMRHRMLNLIRQKRIREDFIERLAAYIETQGDIPVQRLYEAELAMLLDKEIERLPEKMRAVFEFSRRQGLSHKEIAAKLNISDKTVKKQISNAIKIIRYKLEGLTVLAGAFWELLK